MHLGFLNLILLYGDNIYVSATHVVIFSVVSARIHKYIYSVSGSLESSYHKILGFSDWVPFFE